ncbi:beta-ketoacyl synthase N-terminal-like domain-containing protein [Streptomyces sp. NPDC058676]|uniref:beta-ketoacyl synthase N-terminal-like domain-containing protein n=1 Tax=unclassified Streptomyces TaxID=2593676 RepID=UPI00364B61AA
MAPSADIAVTGLACRYPGARDHEEFWSNLVAGRDTVSRSPDRPTAAGGTYTPARGVLDRPEWFDAEYFGCSPREASLLSPQHRMFLECAAEALDHAGHDPGRHPGLLGVYAGGTDTGYDRTLRESGDSAASLSDLEILLGTAPDYLAGRVAYKLGLRGPAVTVQAACATALVAVHTAIRALLAGDCDMALAGGAAVRGPEKESPYTPGGIISRTGVCRAFDANADGTVGSDGVGVVVLRPLEAALADGDPVHAVLRGSAVGNDGPDRVGFTAPGVLGQARVVRAAQRAAGVAPATIGYVEAHGTATPLGDPIEVAALTRAFEEGAEGFGDRERPCRIGAVKSNIGHTDAAAGAAGLIKAVLAVERGLIPPTAHFTRPNAQIDFAGTPFEVAERAEEWDGGPGPRRAGVSSFGIGGSNAHVVVEEPPAAPPGAPEDGSPQLLVLSAASPEALSAMADRLAEHLRAHPELPVTDVCRTLQEGRRVLRHRALAVVDSAADAVAALTEDRADRLTVAGPDGTDGLDDGVLAQAGALAETGRQWLNGETPDWPALHGNAPRRRVILPGYPFQRQRYVVEGPHRPSPAQDANDAPAATEAAAGAGEAAAHTCDDGSATLQKLFADILGLPEIGPDDSFFDLGGDSLVAAQLLDRVRASYGADLDTLDLYDAQSPGELAVLLKKRSGATTAR